MKIKKYVKGLLLFCFFTSVIIASEKSQNSTNKIPDFYANDQDGELWQLSANLDKDYLVVYFYPAAMTGGCTKQACAYRDDLSVLKKMGVRVVGVSGDAVKNLKWFAEAHNLNFALLSDINGDIARLFNLPLRDGGTIQKEIQGEEKFLTRSYTSVRWTFILNKKGEVVYKNQDVKAADDSKQVIEIINKF